jgi:hypothetical protein
MTNKNMQTSTALGNIAEVAFENLLKKNKVRHTKTDLVWWGKYWEAKGKGITWHMGRDGEKIPYVQDLPMQCDFIVGNSLFIETKYLSGASASGESYPDAAIEIFATSNPYDEKYSGIMKCGRCAYKDPKYDAILAIWNAHDKQWYFFCAKKLWNKYKNQYTGYIKANDGNSINPGLVTKIPWNDPSVAIKQEDFVSLLKRHLDKS